MLQALLAGVASIKAQQQRMNVIGNNLANVNTTAYKGSRVTFQDMLSQTIRGATRPSVPLGGTNAVQFGLGVLVGGTDVNHEQGSLSATNRPADLAVQGTGLFLTSNGERFAFTRDGAFDLDAAGDLVHRATGERVLGWDFIRQGDETTSRSINPIAGDPARPQSKINVPIGRLNVTQVTGNARFDGNLNAATTPGLPAGDLNNWSSLFTVYNAQGGAHQLTIDFYNRTVVNPAGAEGEVATWDWRVTDGAGTVYATSNAATRMRFLPNGTMTAASQAVARPVTVTTVPAALNFTVNLNLANITQLRTTSQVGMSQQDGFPPGSLSGFTIGNNGLITGFFTNGLNRSVGVIAMAIFPNPGGLERIGNNQWRQTDNSGIAVVGTPQTGGRGNINSGFLEQSNVDIGNEFTDLIITQRGFQANTRVVSTVDEMLETLINMKR